MTISPCGQGQRLIRAQATMRKVLSCKGHNWVRRFQKPVADRDEMIRVVECTRCHAFSVQRIRGRTKLGRPRKAVAGVR